MPVSSKDIENHLVLHRHASIAFLDVIKKNQFRQCEEIPPARSKLQPESKSTSSLPETSACSRAQYIANYTIDLSQRSPGTNFLQNFNTSLGSQGNPFFPSRSSSRYIQQSFSMFSACKTFSKFNSKFKCNVSNSSMPQRKFRCLTDGI